MRITLLNFHKDAGKSNIIANILYIHSNARTHTHTHNSLFIRTVRERFPLLGGLKGGSIFSTIKCTQRA